MHRRRPASGVFCCCLVLGLSTGCGAGSGDDVGTTVHPDTKRPSASVVVAARADGSVHVREDVRRTSGVYNIDVSPMALLYTTAVDGFHPQISGFTVRAPGQRTETVPHLRDDDAFYYAQPIQEAVIEYDVSGALLESHPSSPGRRLLVFRDIESTLTADVVRRVTIQDAQNVACWTGGRSFRPCGHAVAGGWMVTLAPRRATQLLVAQVDVG
jgi:hypothetical protein